MVLVAGGGEAGAVVLAAGLGEAGVVVLAVGVGEAPGMVSVLGVGRAAVLPVGAGRPRRIAVCRSRSAGEGSVPSVSARPRRSSSNAASASAGRPSAVSARR